MTSPNDPATTVQPFERPSPEVIARAEANCRAARDPEVWMDLFNDAMNLMERA